MLPSLVGMASPHMRLVHRPCPFLPGTGALCAFSEGEDIATCTRIIAVEVDRRKPKIGLLINWTKNGTTRQPPRLTTASQGFNFFLFLYSHHLRSF